MTLTPKLSQILLIIIAPHKKVMAGKKARGPSLRRMTVAGGWNKTYGMKKMRVMME